MKNATEKTGLGGLWIVFIAAVIAALPLRVLQYLNVIEKGTGFYTGLHWSIFALFGVLTAAVAICVILGLTRRSKVGYLKDGGRLVYSTCTLNPAENQGVCDRFLAEHPEFRAIRVLPQLRRMDDTAYRTLMPHVHGTDGFFIAAFEKSGGGA